MVKNSNFILKINQKFFSYKNQNSCKYTRHKKNMIVIKNSIIVNDSLNSENSNLLTAVSIYTAILFFISSFTNSSLIIIILKNKKELLQNVNVLSLALGFFNLIGTLIGLPVAAITALKHEYIFGKYGCHLEAYSFYFTIFACIYIFVCVSIIRFVQTVFLYSQNNLKAN